MSSKITIIKGDDVTIACTFTDEVGTPINITDYTVFLTVKNDVGLPDASALITKDVTSHSSPTTGQTNIVLTNAQTSSVNAGVYKYDIQLKSGSGAITSTQAGEFEVLQDITTRTS